MVSRSIRISAVRPLLAGRTGSGVFAMQEGDTLQALGVATMGAAGVLLRAALFVARLRPALVGNREVGHRGIGGHAPLDASERAAWTTLARVLLNTDEFITRE